MRPPTTRSDRGVCGDLLYNSSSRLWCLRLPRPCAIVRGIISTGIGGAAGTIGGPRIGGDIGGDSGTMTGPRIPIPDLVSDILSASRRSIESPRWPLARPTSAT